MKDRISVVLADALILSTEALRESRHLLETLVVQMFGAGFTPDPNSKLQRLLQDMKAAEQGARRALLEARK